MSTKDASITGSAPMFLVDDVKATAEWYQRTLGFNIGQYYMDDHSHDEDGNDIAGSSAEAVFVIVERDGHRLMLGKTMRKGDGVRSNYDFKQYSGDAYFWCEGIDAIYGRAKDAGADVLLEPTMQPYGLKEFQLRDLDGRMLTFGEPAER